MIDGQVGVGEVQFPLAGLLQGRVSLSGIGVTGRMHCEWNQTTDWGPRRLSRRAESSSEE